mmetsp:Transcript_19178/g.37927  ORF Transcript_19178/g.37927 Transcript_19178/m.37927 type:complete len:535 (+) Transcript_19178:34-1638(+)
MPTSDEDRELQKILALSLKEAQEREKQKTEMVQANAESSKVWSCPMCTFTNLHSNDECEMCGNKMPAQVLAPIPAQAFEPEQSLGSEEAKLQEPQQTTQHPVVEEDCKELPSELLQPPEMLRQDSFGSWGDAADNEGDIDDMWDEAEKEQTFENQNLSSLTMSEIEVLALSQILQDVDEISNGFGYPIHFKRCLDRYNKMSLMVSLELKLTDFGLDHEQTRVWNADPHKSLTVVCHFSQLYVHSEQSGHFPPSISVCQRSFGEVEFDMPSKQQRASTGLLWVLQNRIDTTLCVAPMYPPTHQAGPINHEYIARAEHFDAIAELCEIADLGDNWRLALEAIEQTQNPEEAQELLFDPERRKALTENVQKKVTLSRKEGNERSSLTSSLLRKTESIKSSSTKSSNYLTSLLEFVTDTTLTCTGHCILCWEKLPFAGYKPVVCDKAICIFKSSELGIGSDLLSEVKAAPEVVDLIISFAFAALAEDKIGWFYPTGVLYPATNHSEELSFNTSSPDGSVSKNLPLLKEVCKQSQQNKE